MKEVYVLYKIMLMSTDIYPKLHVWFAWKGEGVMNGRDSMEEWGAFHLYVRLQWLVWPPYR